MHLDHQKHLAVFFFTTLIGAWGCREVFPFPEPPAPERSLSGDASLLADSAVDRGFLEPDIPQRCEGQAQCPPTVRCPGCLCCDGICVDTFQDPQHCGGCLRPCLGKEPACEQGRCNQPSMMIFSSDEIFGIAMDDNHIYFTQSSTVNRIPVTTSSPQALPAEVATGQITPRGITVDHTRVYWVSPDNGVSRRLKDLDRSDIDHPSKTPGVRISTTDASIFWWGDQSIHVMDKPPSFKVEFSVGNAREHFAVNDEALYFRGAGTSGEIFERLLAINFISEISSNEDGSDGALALDGDGLFLYWANTNTGQIRSANLTNPLYDPQLQDLGPSLAHPSKIAVDEQHLFVSVSSNDPMDPLPRLIRLSRSTGAVDELWDGDAGEAILEILVDPERVVWLVHGELSQEDQIWKMEQ